MDDYFEEKGRPKKRRKPCTHIHTVGKLPDMRGGGWIASKVHRDRILDRGAFYLNLPLWRVASKRLPIKASPSILPLYTKIWWHDQSLVKFTKKKKKTDRWGLKVNSEFICNICHCMSSV